jgi:hypothetical protein
MKSKQELAEYVRLRPGIANNRVAKNLRRHNVTTRDVQEARELLGTKSAGAPAVRKTVASLLNQYDDVAKVQKAMDRLPPDHYLEDDEMRRQNVIAIDRWRVVRSHPNLSGFIFKLPNGRSVWMHPEAQKSLLEAINLSKQ